MPSRWALQGVAVQQGEAAQRPRAEHRVPQPKDGGLMCRPQSPWLVRKLPILVISWSRAGVRMWLEHDSQPPKVESTKQGPIRANR